MKTWFLLFAFVLNALAFPLYAQETEEEKATLVSVGQPVPDFQFTDEAGNIHAIKDLRGKLVMINFFATWCGPCMKELPHVQQEIFEKYQNNDKFELLVIGREHSAQEMEAFKAKKGYTFGLIADPNRKIYANFASQFIPRNFIIDQEGKIIYSSIGFNEDEFAQLLKTIEQNLN